MIDKSQVLLNPSVGELIRALHKLPPGLPVGCHSMGNGIDIRVYGEHVTLVGFNHCPDSADGEA